MVFQVNIHMNFHLLYEMVEYFLTQILDLVLGVYKEGFQDRT